MIESFSEDVENRSRDKPRLDFELKLGETDDPSKLTTNLVASDKTNPLATGLRNFLEPLLEKIVQHQDLPIVEDVASYQKEYRVRKETDDHEWYLVRTRAVETLETKYGLQKRTPSAASLAVSLECWLQLVPLRTKT